MSLVETATVVAALALSLWLGWRARPAARFALVAITLLVSAAMFLPGTLLVSLIDSDLLAAIDKAARRWHLTPSDLAHFVAFFLLAAALWTWRPEWRGWRALALLVALAIGGELMQGLGDAQRSPKLVDVGINLLGAVLGVFVAAIAVRFANPRDRR